MKAKLNTVMSSVLEALGRAFSVRRPAHSGHQTSEWEIMS
jgi:hypothetical protein